MLYDPAQFEPPTDEPWDEGRVRDAIAAIVADADAAIDPETLWPVYDWDGWETPRQATNLYVGAAGVLWAVDALCRIPIHVSYNVSLVDVHGRHATVFVGPTERARVTREVVTTNHQERVHWPQHAARYYFAAVAKRLQLTDAARAEPEQQRREEHRPAAPHPARRPRVRRVPRRTRRRRRFRVLLLDEAHREGNHRGDYR